jgi:hypothetical protein
MGTRVMDNYKILQVGDHVLYGRFKGSKLVRLFKQKGKVYVTIELFPNGVRVISADRLIRSMGF